MKIKLLIILMLGLGLSSCEKNDEQNNESSQTISIHGKDYDVSNFIQGLSRITTIPVEQLYYDQTEGVFKSTILSNNYLPETFAKEIDKLNSK